VAFKIRQNAFLVRASPRTLLTTLPGPLVGWRGDMILPLSALTTKTRHLGLAGWGGIAPKYFAIEERVMEHLALLILHY